MPMLYALGQHQALRSVQSRLRPHERFLAFHDDVHAVAQPERIVAVKPRSRTRVVPSGYETLSRSSSHQSSRRGLVWHQSSGHSIWYSRVCQVVGCHRGRSPVVASADPSSAGLVVNVFFCCFAFHHGRHFTCVYVILTTRKLSLVSTMFTLGSVSPRCWGNGKSLGRGSLPFHLGGLGLRSAHRSARAAFWG